MNDSDQYFCNSRAYNKLTTEVRIPRGITAISESAFARSGLQKVVLPDSVREIGVSAFGDCRSLTNVRLPRYAKIARTHEEEKLIEHPQRQGCIKETVSVPGAFSGTPFGKNNDME